MTAGTEALVAVVRQLGSGRQHVARVQHDDLTGVRVFSSLGYVVTLDPVATVCGAALRKSRGAVVVMREADVNCRPCARLSGVSSTADVATLITPSSEVPPLPGSEDPVLLLAFLQISERASD